MASLRFGCVSFGVAVNAVTGHGYACNRLRDDTFHDLASFIHIQMSDFAPDLRQAPYEVILHVRICAGGPLATAVPTAITFSVDTFMIYPSKLAQCIGT